MHQNPKTPLAKGGCDRTLLARGGCQSPSNLLRLGPSGLAEPMRSSRNSRSRANYKPCPPPRRQRTGSGTSRQLLERGDLSITTRPLRDRHDASRLGGRKFFQRFAMCSLSASRLKLSTTRIIVADI